MFFSNGSEVENECKRQDRSKTGSVVWYLLRLKSHNFEKAVQLIFFSDHSDFSRLGFALDQKWNDVDLFLNRFVLLSVGSRGMTSISFKELNRDRKSELLVFQAQKSPWKNLYEREFLKKMSKIQWPYIAKFFYLIFVGISRKVGENFREKGEKYDFYGNGKIKNKLNDSFKKI